MKDNRRRSGLRTALIALLLAAATLAVYAPVTGHRFIDYDDDAYVVRNPMVLGGLSLGAARWAFTTRAASNWHPLTWLSHQLDVSLFGLDPGRHHLTSLLLHAANAVLLFLFLRACTGAAGASAFAAALFALHPLHVESVAWVAERKDVLSTLFWLATLGCYLRYLRRPAAWRFLAVVLALGLGLLAKPMLVTLPLVLLVLDWWPLGRITRRALAGGGLGRVLLEKVPLLSLAAASSVITYRVQAEYGAVEPGTVLTLPGRLADAAVACVTYLGKTVWPSSLAFFYPRPPGGFPAGRVLASALLLGALSLAAAMLARRGPWLAAGWLWFLGTLVPVSGLLVKVGAQALADRYTYVPLVGIFLMIAWSLPAPRGVHRRAALAAGGVVLLVFLSLAARAQVGHWKDSESLYRHALSVTRDNWIAENALGVLLTMQGRDAEAMEHYRAVVRIEPEYAKGRFNLGLALARRERYEDAAAQFREALQLDPGYVKAEINLGLALTRLGRWVEAVEHYRLALELDPGNEDARRNLTVALAATGRTGEDPSRVGGGKR